MDLRRQVDNFKEGLFLLKDGFSVLFGSVVNLLSLIIACKVFRISEEHLELRVFYFEEEEEGFEEGEEDVVVDESVGDGDAGIDSDVDVGAGEDFVLEGFDSHLKESKFVVSELDSEKPSSPVLARVKGRASKTGS